MLRAGPLSSAAVIEKLNDKFVSAWVLRQDLASLAGDAAKNAKSPLPLPKGTAPASQPDPRLKSFAARVYEKYEYPVDSLLFDAEGGFVEHFPASKMMEDFDADTSYLKFLAEAAVR